jgi:hypothetical protein
MSHHHQQQQQVQQHHGVNSTMHPIPWLLLHIPPHYPAAGRAAPWEDLLALIACQPQQHPGPPKLSCFVLPLGLGLCPPAHKHPTLQFLTRMGLWLLS